MSVNKEVSEMDKSIKRGISRFDMLVYRLFYWRWKPLLEKDPILLSLFREWIDGYTAERELLAAERERIQAGQVCTDKSHWQ